MSLPEHEQAKVDQFFAEIQPLSAGYRHQTIRYLTVRSTTGFLCLQMIVSLSARPPAPKPAAYKTEHVFCEERSLESTQFSPRRLVDAITTGSVQINGRALNLPPEDHTSNHTVNHVHFDGTREPLFERAARLMVMGGNGMYVHAQDLAYLRELKANPVSYEGIPALATAFGLSLHGVMGYMLEVHASRVAEVVNTQNDDGTGATIVFWLAGTLPTEGLVVSLRATAGANSSPAPLPSSAAVQWSRDDGGDWKGLLPLAWPSSDATVTCIVSYAGVVQHEKSFTPARATSNMLRTVLDIFDPARTTLKAVIDNHKLTDRDAQRLEQAMGAILAMRGFRVLNLDKVPGLQEIPDIVAVDADNNILVVECTLNLPNAEMKLAKLLRRRDAIRRGLDDKDLRDIKVVGILAVAQTPDTLRPFQAEVDKHRVIMWSSTELQSLAADDSQPNSPEVLHTAWEAVAALDWGLPNSESRDIS